MGRTPFGVGALRVPVLLGNHTLTERADTSSPTNPVMVFEDSQGNSVASFDDQGNLKLKGFAFLGARPDRADAQGN